MHMCWCATIFTVGKENPKGQDPSVYHWILEVSDAITHGKGEETAEAHQ